MKVRFVSAFVALLLVATVLSPLASLSSAQAAPPEQGVVLSTPYTSVVAGRGKDISFPLTILNRGTSDEQIDLAIQSPPEGWQVSLKDKEKGLVIRSMFLTAGISQTVTLEAKPPADVASGDYKFAVQATTKSGAKQSLDITVGIAAAATGSIKLNTYYPKLSGSSTSTFDFNVDLINGSDDERSVGLTTTQPPDWRVSLRPSGESKEISSFRMRGGENKGMAISVTPPTKATAGEYTLEVQAVSGENKDSIKLQVVLLGNYEISVTTSSGAPLNASATAGSPTTVSLDITNRGSAELKDVSLTSSKPDNWETVFNPDKLDVLAPGQTRQVNVSIKPGAKALAGDYEVTLTASSGTTSSNVKIRTSVETSTTWGWIGLGLIVLVAFGLTGLFYRLGRR